MAFIPETGSGTADANSFVDLDYADAYHEERGNVYWSSLADKATGVAIFSGNFSDGAQVVIGSNTYTFNTSVQAGANSVLIGADVTESIANLVAAINRTFSLSGTKFSSATVLNPDVTATSDAGTLAIEAKVAGVTANAITLSTTASGPGWSSATMVGGSKDKQEQCCTRATDYIEKRFSRMWRGARQQKDQGLSWPRIGAYDDDGYTLDAVPKNLQKATCEYAMRAGLYNVLAPDGQRIVAGQNFGGASVTVTEQTRTGAVKSKREKVGPIEVSESYESIADIVARNSAALSRATQSNMVNDFIIPEYPEADLLIETLVDPGVGPSTLGRA